MTGETFASAILKTEWFADAPKLGNKLGHINPNTTPNTGIISGSGQTAMEISSQAGLGKAFQSNETNFKVREPTGGVGPPTPCLRGT